MLKRIGGAWSKLVKELLAKIPRLKPVLLCEIAEEPPPDFHDKVSKSDQRCNMALITA